MIEDNNAKIINLSIFFIGVLVTTTTWFLGGSDIGYLLANEIKLSSFIVLCLWIIWLAVCTLKLYYSDISLLMLRPMVFLLLVLLVGLTLDNDKIKFLLYPINLLIDWLADFLGNYRRHIPSAGKIGHIVAFGALTVTLLNLRKQLSVGVVGILAFCLLVALSTETLQLYVPTRTPALKDFIFDCFGIGLALVWFGKGRIMLLRNSLAKALR